MRIVTRRLILRRWEAGDAQRLIEIAGQPHIEHWMPDWREYDKHAKGWIEWVQRNYEKDDPAKAFVSWAVTLREGGQLIGQVAIGPFDELGDKEIGIAYFVDAAQVRRGYATEAVRCAARYAFDRYGYDHLIATIQPGNAASRGVAEKAGFRYVKIVRFKDSGQTRVLPFGYFRLEKGGGDDAGSLSSIQP